MIVRDWKLASRRQFDLVVIGGGIYGTSLLWEAAQRGLTVCLCEAADFGGETSWNSLRIVHGGLRYLQTLNIRRFFQSVASRRDLARLFPGLVRPLACYMPLYGKGLRRASVMRMALAMSDGLSMGRNRALPVDAHLPAGRIISSREARDLMPQIREVGLEGVACWYDYQMISSERILMELLRDACRYKAVALNYCRVVKILSDRSHTRGVRVRDRLTNTEFDIESQTVVNCAGPWTAELLQGEVDKPDSLFIPSLAFNLLLDVDLGFTGALAVAPPSPGSPMLFLVQCRGVLMAGTRHLSRLPGTRCTQPTTEEVSEFLEMINEALPGLHVNHQQVRRVLAGVLPVQRVGSVNLKSRESLTTHSATGGPAGLHSVVGVKYTTAGAVARDVIDRLFPDRPGVKAFQPPVLSSATPLLTNADQILSGESKKVAASLCKVCKEEAVSSVEDLVYRRASWLMGSVSSTDIVDKMTKVFGDSLPVRIDSAA